MSVFKIFRRFREWRLRRRAIAAALYRKRGYDWAMASLSSGELTQEQIFNYCDNPFNGRDAFDHGAVSATFIYEACGVDPEWAKTLEKNETELQHVPHKR